MTSPNPSLLSHFLLALLYMLPTEMVDLYFGCVPPFINKVLYCTSGDLPQRLYERLLEKMFKGKQFIINTLSSCTKAAGYSGASALLGKLLFGLLI